MRYQYQSVCERPAVLQLLNDTKLCGQKLTLDALHLTPKATKAIHKAKGVYLIGLKSNQKHLHRYCICNSLTKKASYERAYEPQRGHAGRPLRFVR